MDGGIEIVERAEERCRVRTKAGVENVELAGCMYEVRRFNVELRVGMEWSSSTVKWVLERAGTGRSRAK
jgi:hypothetical protein